MINRAAIILRYKEPAIRWLNKTKRAAGHSRLNINEVNRERTIYLIDSTDGESDEAVFKWVAENFMTLFDSELHSWFVDAEKWPSHRSFKLFQNWFYVECHTVIFDTIGGEIRDDEM